jgi:hypothetical protein
VIIRGGVQASVIIYASFVIIRLAEAVSCGQWLFAIVHMIARY